MIKTRKLTKKFKSGSGELIAVNNVDLDIKTGEFLAITGRSGSGKSTLLYQLGLLDRPTSGEIYLDNKDVLKMSEVERTKYRLSKLGYVFQDYAILPMLNSIENVVLPLLMMGLSSKEARKIAEESLVKVGLSEKLGNYPSQLSGGEQQRVSIARAIAHDPDILFADEPTANLDHETSQVIMDLFKKLHKDGQTIVMITHEDEYAHMAGRILELDDGKVVKNKVN